MHYDEQGFLPAEMLALFLDYCALCRIVEIVCTIAELGAIFLKSTVKRCTPRPLPALFENGPDPGNTNH